MSDYKVQIKNVELRKTNLLKCPRLTKYKRKKKFLYLAYNNIAYHYPPLKYMYQISNSMKI